MFDVESLKRAKRKALLTLVVFSVFFVCIMLYIAKDEALLILCISQLILWDYSLSEYKKICMKIEIHEELEKKAVN